MELEQSAQPEGRDTNTVADANCRYVACVGRCVERGPADAEETGSVGNRDREIGKKTVQFVLGVGGHTAEFGAGDQRSDLLMACRRSGVEYAGSTGIGEGRTSVLCMAFLR